MERLSNFSETPSFVLSPGQNVPSLVAVHPGTTEQFCRIFSNACQGWVLCQNVPIQALTPKGACRRSGSFQELVCNSAVSQLFPQAGLIFNKQQRCRELVPISVAIVIGSF